MNSRNVSRPAAARVSVRLLLVCSVFAGPGVARGQATQPLPLFAFEATPIGALPPMALPMPASRDYNYWGLRLQAGQRREGGLEDLLAVAGGVDLQLRGGSIFGVTGGYQWRQHCQPPITDCGGHSLYGARARFNVVTAGPTLAGLWRDGDATTTIGTEMGLGYAPKVTPKVNACTFDTGLPLSIATGERFRFVSFNTPGLVWDVDCSGQSRPAARSFFLGGGLGIQQLGFRGLDVQVGLQRVFRGSTGMQVGVSVTWVRLP